MYRERLHLIDDGFGNLLEACGSWYDEHPEAPVPAGMIRANYDAALMFVFGHWHQDKKAILERRVVRNRQIYPGPPLPRPTMQQTMG
jgi:hypothetical protein